MESLALMETNKNKLIKKMKQSNSVCIKFHYEKYSKELEIGYNEENRFHAIIKTNEDLKRKGIIIDRNGNLINNFHISNYEGIEDIDAAMYLDSFLIAHLHEGLYNAMLYILKNRSQYE